jgi:hypothetical protein
MTKARTSNFIFLIDIMALPLFYYAIRIKKIILIILCLSTIGFAMNFAPPFFVGRVDSSSSEYHNTIQDKTVQQYYEHNIKTIVDKNARSNGSRLINIQSHFNVICDHTFLGTGIGLKDLYVKDHLTDNALDNSEIRGITNKIEKIGILKSSYGNVNHFVYLATNEGIPGVFIFLIPCFYATYLLYKKRLFRSQYHSVLFIVLLGSLAGSMTGETLPTMYITLGLLYAGLDCEDNLSAKKCNR